MIPRMRGRTNSQPLLDADHATFLLGGVSIIVASRSPALVADVVRGCGCRVSRDRRRVRVLVESAHAAALLENIALTGMIALVCSQPSTHRTIQLKGTDAAIVTVTAADRRIADRHLGAWVEELVAVGFPADFAAAVRGRAETGLAAIAFTPTSAFEQTPGPAAGSRLGMGA
jgi:hypothetical protein